MTCVLNDTCIKLHLFWMTPVLNDTCIDWHLYWSIPVFNDTCNGHIYIYLFVLPNMVLCLSFKRIQLYFFHSHRHSFLMNKVCKLILTESLRLRLLTLDMNSTKDRVPTQTGKPGKWEGIFQSGKSQVFWTDWKSQGKSHKILENSGNLR